MEGLKVALWREDFSYFSETNFFQKISNFQKKPPEVFCKKRCF